MTAASIVGELRTLGSESYRKILLNHGASEPAIGVKIADLKKLHKRLKKDHELALDLFATGIYDAQYLAGLIADEEKMTKRHLKRWLATGNCPAICSSIVAWVAAESRHAHALAVEWIASKKENVAQTGWATLASLVSITDDAELDLAELKKLLKKIGASIHRQPNHVRYAMNGFVIAVGTYVGELTEAAIKTGESIGVVTVDMGDTACQVPSAPDYIRKVQKRGAIGKKRKSAKC